VPVAVTRITAHPTLYCFALIAPLPRSGTVQFPPTRGSLMAIPFFTRNKQARLSINTNLACRFPLWRLPTPLTARSSVINSSVTSTIATGDQLQAEASARASTPAGASVPSFLALVRWRWPLDFRIQSGVALSTAVRGVYFTLAGPMEDRSVNIGPTPIDAVCPRDTLGTRQSRRFDP